MNRNIHLNLKNILICRKFVQRYGLYFISQNFCAISRQSTGTASALPHSRQSPGTASALALSSPITRYSLRSGTFLANHQALSPLCRCSAAFTLIISYSLRAAVSCLSSFQRFFQVGFHSRIHKLDSTPLGLPFVRLYLRNCIATVAQNGVRTTISVSWCKGMAKLLRFTNPCPTFFHFFLQAARIRQRCGHDVTMVIWSKSFSGRNVSHYNNKYYIFIL